MATSLIDELQLDASNNSVSVSSLLRKALMVAAKLAVFDIPEWINKELSGYGNGDSLPLYRILHGTIKARNLRGWIPVQFPTSEFRDMVSTHDLREPVGQIEALIKRDGHLVFGFTPEQQQLLQTLFQFETEFTGFLERTHLDRILDEIRNQVLRWAIALDKAGVRGDGLSFSNEEKDKAHSMIFHAGARPLARMPARPR